MNKWDARAIIQCGVHRVVCGSPDRAEIKGDWRASMGVALIMLAEARVELTYSGEDENERCP